MDANLVSYSGVCTSPMLSCVTSLTQGPNGESNIGRNSSPVEHSSMVSSDHEDVNGSLNSSSRSGNTVTPSPNYTCPVQMALSRLVAWKAAGDSSRRESFQKKLANLSSHHDDTKQMQTTIPPGGNGKKGVNPEIYSSRYFRSIRFSYRSV